MKRYSGVVVTLLLLLALLGGCRVGAAPLNEPVTIPVAATENFGKAVVFEREAIVETRMTAAGVLGKVTEYQTDGSYILEFEGRRGDDEVYWMYYVNGLLSRYFAGGYPVRPGDVMQWDFHPWAGAHQGSSAIIGSFPEPMRHGYEGRISPTIVVYGEGFREKAGIIAAGLRDLGVAGVAVTAEGELAETDRGGYNLVLLADSRSGLITELNDRCEPLGMYACFEDGAMRASDYRFQEGESYGAGAGVFQACQNPWNPLGTGACENAVFMISGVDAAGVDRAAAVVIESIEALRDGETPAIANAFGVVVTPDGEIVRLPR